MEIYLNTVLILEKRDSMQIVIYLFLLIALGIAILAYLDQNFAKQLKEKSTFVIAIIFTAGLSVGFGLGVYLAPLCSAWL